MASPHRNLIALVLLSISAPAFAAARADGNGPAWQPYEPSERAHSRYCIKSFLEDAGLSGRFVFFIDFDRDGNTWIASSEGLHVYDGYTWKSFSQKDGLPSNFVRCLCIARDGTVWIGTNRGIATLDRNGRISILEDAGLAGPNVRRIVQDDDGTLWFCSDTWLTPDATSGLASYRDGRWTVYRKSDGLPSDYVSDYFRDSSGRQYALCRNGLAQREGERWIRPLERENLEGSDGYFWSMAESPIYGVLATSERSIFALRAGKWSRIDYSRPEFTNAKVVALASGNVVTLSNGYDAEKRFFSWNGSDFVRLTDAVSVPGEATYVTEAPDGSVWCTGYDLLLCWMRSDNEWVEYPDILSPQLVDGAGRIWFIAEGAVLRMSRDDQWESYACRVDRLVKGRDTDVVGLSAHTMYEFQSDDVIIHGSEQTGVRRIRGQVTDALGRMWLYGQDRDERNVFSVLDGASWITRAPSAIQGEILCKAVPDRSSGVYFLVSDRTNEFTRLVHIDGNKTQSIVLPEVATGYKPGVHVDYAGNLWLFGQFGLFRRDDGAWQRVEGIPGEWITGAVNGLHETWIAYDGMVGGRAGLGRWRDGVWSFMDLDKRPRVLGPNPDATSLFATHGALYRRDGNSGHGLARITWPFRRAVRAAVHGRNGDGWFGLGDRVVRYRSDGVPPQTFIVKADREVRRSGALAVNVRGVERSKPRGEATLTYSWRVGQEPWTEFGPPPNEVLVESLSPGHYTFEVRARDEGLDIDPSPARLAFTVTAIPWSQRAWFWPVVATLFTGLAFLGVLAVIERNRARYYAAKLERTVTERTSELGQSEARFRAMCAAAPIPMLICRKSDGAILYANRLLGETLGIARDQLIGRRFDDHFGDGCEFHRLCKEVVEDGTAFGREILTKRADGSQLWSLASFQTMVYEREPALIAGLHDITGQRQAAEELERARCAAEVASKAKSVFLANVTHEVRTPIMAMLGAAEAAATSPQDGRYAVDHAEVITRNGRHLLALFDNLLDLACLDAGEFVARPVRCSLPEILADVGAIARPARDNPDVDFEIVCENAIPRQIHTDPVRLKQALINLINNALKFTTSGYVRVLVRVDADKTEPRLSIAVEDTGPGIPDADMKRMFEPFEQVAPRSGQLVDGVGLGLPLARRIAEELGGAVRVKSQVGKGSVFTLTAKTGSLQTVDWIKPEEINAALGRPETIPDPRTFSTLSGSVLLAEDTSDTRELIATAFRSRGADVTTVENGRQAVEAASKRAYDLILMDIRMPVMDGVAATVELRKRGYLAPIIALTASVAKGDYPGILTKGFDDLWTKPISLERIIEQSSDYLRSGDRDGRSGTPETPGSGLVSDGDARLGAIKAEFRRDLPGRVRSVRTAIENGDLETARELLHKLAGTAGMMDIMPLSIEAARAWRETKQGKGLHADDFLKPIESLVHEITTNGDSDADPIPPSGQT